MTAHYRQRPGSGRGKPTAGITAGDATADESGQQPASFEVTRTGTDFDVPLTSTTASAARSTPMRTSSATKTEMILDGTATIPPAARRPSFSSTRWKTIPRAGRKRWT